MPRKFFWVVALFVALCGLFFRYQLRPVWSGWIYATDDNGLETQLIGDFPDGQTCARAATEKLKAGTLIERGCPGTPCPATRYLCGRNCHIDAEFGAVFAEEIVCDEKITL